MKQLLALRSLGCGKVEGLEEGVVWLGVDGLRWAGGGVHNIRRRFGGGVWCFFAEQDKRIVEVGGRGYCPVVSRASGGGWGG